MHLLNPLSITSADEIDPDRPLQLGPYILGQEAAAEASRIINGGEFETQIALNQKIVKEPFFWSIMHRSEGYAEIFALPSELSTSLSTATEIAIVRAVAALEPDHHHYIFEGGIQVSMGPPNSFNQFNKIVDFIGPPAVGNSSLYRSSTEAIISDDIGNLLTQTAIHCFKNSFFSSPLKFRFLELYRVMEARFLADIKAKLLDNFDSGPSAALGDATAALRSELKQLGNLADQEPAIFEECWTVLDRMKNTNRFVAALFRNIQRKGHASGAKYQTGAALIYQTRCAIVHAGEKDMIFESFDDAEAALEAVLPSVERASLLLVGIELL